MPVTLNIIESTTELGQEIVQVVLASASEPGPAGPGVPTGGTDGQVLTKTSASDYATAWEDPTGGSGGAPTDADYLVGTANGTLTNEIAVGTTPGGELGGTWSSPTVDAVHSGSSHAAIQAAAEATAASALSAHETDTTSVHGIADTSTLYRTGGTDVAVADGGTGASDASGARTNLGLVIGTDVASQSAFADHSARHEDGGADEISLTGLSGTSAALQAHLDDTTDAHDASAISSVAAGNLASTDVQAALNELDSEKAATASAVMDGDAAGGVLGGTYPNPSFAADMATQAELDAHITDSTAAHAASAISIADAGNDFTATDVEGALDELQADAEADATALSDHIADTSAAHAASAISVSSATLSGTGTDVQAVFEEIDNLLDDHSARHENGGADEISVAGLSGELADAQPITVRKNTGSDVGTRSRLNFIEGSNVTLTVTDDAGSDEVDITIASSGGSSSPDYLTALLFAEV